MGEIRAGDVVDHRPTGETWVVAAVRGGELIPAGWPITVARIEDCELVEHGDDHDHRTMVQRCRELADARARWSSEHTCSVCDPRPELVR